MTLRVWDVLLFREIGNRLTVFDTLAGVLMKGKAFSDTLLNTLINIYIAYLPAILSRIYYVVTEYCNKITDKCVEEIV
jgi:uncharacterized membrane protein YqaE (UPF0057 family)